MGIFDERAPDPREREEERKRRSPKSVKPRATGPGTNAFLTDAESWRGMYANVKELVSRPQDIPASALRGSAKNWLGGPVDIANQMMLAGKIGGDKPVGGSAWFGEKLPQWGMLPKERESPTGRIAEELSAFTSPVGAAKKVAMAAPLLLGVKSSRRPPIPKAREGEEYVFGHNLNEDNLKAAILNTGGSLPGASLFAAKTSTIPVSFAGRRGVTLLAHPEDAAPGGNWGARWWKGDAYTPTFPETRGAPMAEHQIQNLQALVDPVADWHFRPSHGREDYGMSFYRLMENVAATHPDDLHGLYPNPLLAARFLQEQGRLPKLKTRQDMDPRDIVHSSSVAQANHTALLQEIGRMEGDPRTSGRYGNWLMDLHKRIGYTPSKEIVMPGALPPGAGMPGWSQLREPPTWEPLTPENVIAAMQHNPMTGRRDPRGGQNVGGIAHQRAMVAQQFRTPEGMRRARDSVMDSGEAAQHLEGLGDERAALAQLPGFMEPGFRSRWDGSMHEPSAPNPEALGSDLALAFLKYAPLQQKYPSMTPRDERLGMEWVRRLQEAPVDYHEGKALAVPPHIRNFRAAILGPDATTATRERLIGQGMPKENIFDQRNGVGQRMDIDDVIRNNDYLRRLLMSRQGLFNQQEDVA